VLFANFSVLPDVFMDIFTSAFTARAAEGGFIGSTMMLAMSHGVRRGCYSTDIGVGYASIIHSSSSSNTPERQASLLIFEVFMDTFFVCSMSVLLVLTTGTWKESLDSILLVQEALGKYFPYMNIFMPFFLSLLGYSTIITYFTAGMHTVRFMLPTWGRRLYYSYAVVAFLTFSFVENRQAISVMSFVGFLLLVLNASAIWKLRREISFDLGQKSPVLESESGIVTGT
jgi:AGCS family alanine or glycine:cation symporter